MINIAEKCDQRNLVSTQPMKKRYFKPEIKEFGKVVATTQTEVSVPIEGI